MRRGLVLLGVLFLQGCLSLGNYASPTLVGEGAWEMGVGTPILTAKVDPTGVDMDAGIYPELFARYGVAKDLEIEGRAVVAPPFGGAVGGGFRWALADSGFRVAVGLSAPYYTFVENITSPSTRWTTLVFYPGIWMGTDRLYSALRGLWAVIGASTSGGDVWGSGSPGIQIVVGQRLRGDVFDALPELTLWLPLPGASPSIRILLGFGIVVHPEQKGGG